MAGRGSLAGLMPYGDANAIVVEMAREVLPVVATTPVLAGVCGTDPFRLMPVFLDELKRIGFSRRPELPDRRADRRHLPGSLEETGMGYGLEVDMIRLAHELDLLTSPYVFNADEAPRDGRGRRRRARAAHGPDDQAARSARATAKTLDESVELVQAMHDAAKAVNPDDPRALPRRPDRRAGRRAPTCSSARPASSASSARRAMERLPTEVGDDREHEALQGDLGRRAGGPRRFSAVYLRVQTPDIVAARSGVGSWSFVSVSFRPATPHRHVLGERSPKMIWIRFAPWGRSSR